MTDRSNRSQPVTSRLRLWLERTRDGYRLRDAATDEVVRHDDPRVRVIKLAGVSYRLDAVQDDGFAPGRRLALVPEPDNEHDPNAIGVWDAERRAHGGYVPADVAAGLDANAWQAVSLLEFFEGSQRVGLRVLLAPKDAWIGAPRT
jgi:HIRAN domain